MMITKKHWVKVLREDLTHYGFTFTLNEVNTDPVPWYPGGSCEAGGFYFTTPEHLPKYLNFGDRIATVTLPEDTPLYADPNGDKWKAPRIILTDIFEFKDHPLFLDPQFVVQAVYYDSSMIKNAQREHLLNPNFLKDCIDSNPYVISFLPSEHMMTDELYLLAVRKNGLVLRHIPVGRRTMEICFAAINKEPRAWSYVPSEHHMALAKQK